MGLSGKMSGPFKTPNLNYVIIEKLTKFLEIKVGMY